MSALAAPPNRSRCRETPTRSAQDPNPAATPLCPCGDPRLHGEAASLFLGYRCARRPTSSSAEIGATLEIVDFVRQWPLLKLGHRRLGKPETVFATPRRPLQVLLSQGRVWDNSTHPGTPCAMAQ